MKVEREREAVWYDGGWHGHVFFGMLEGEWRVRNEKEKIESGSKTLGALWSLLIAAQRQK
jgi:hypothetical protein